MGSSLPGSSVRGISQVRILGSALPFPSPGDLPHPGIEPRCPALQADPLPFEPDGLSEESLLERSLPVGGDPGTIPGH